MEQPISPENKIVKRNPIIAFLFSILTPGLGQLYNGQPAKAAILLALVFIWPFIFGLLRLGTSFQGLCTLVFFELLYRIYIIIDAIIFAVKRKQYKLEKYNTWQVYALGAVLILSFLFIIDVRQLTGIQTFIIPSSGNEPQIKINDRAVADLQAYENSDPEYGDFLVFDRNGEFIVFPVVALPGDTLEIVNNRLVINGKACQYKLLRSGIATVIPEKPSKTTIYEEILPNGLAHEIIQFDVPFDTLIANMPSIVIPSDNYFVMGENRDNAFDSRYAGLVHRNQLAGKLLYCYWGDTPDRIGYKYSFHKK